MSRKVKLNPKVRTDLQNIFLVLFLLLVSCKNKQEKIKPVQEQITESVYASGIIKSTHQYKVFSTVNGLIASIAVKEGDLVKKGDAILKLLNTHAKLNSENAALSANYTAKNNNIDKLNELKIATNLAKSKMIEDALMAKRQQNLWNGNIGSKYELEQKQFAYESSITAFQAAELRYQQLQKQINFQAKQSQNNLKIAYSLNSDFIIRADVDGKVYNITMKQGEMVNTLNPVAIIGDADNFMMELQVDEFDINRIKIGQNIILSMDSYKGKVFEATVTRINPIMNEKSKSFTVEAVFKKQPATLYPNLTCEANIVIQKKEKALIIPRNYLLTGDSVWINSREKRKVVIGLKDYQSVEILSGITPDDFIYKPFL